jgi:hypothetical protein
MVSTGGIHVSTDRGQSFANKNGNWPERGDNTRELGTGFDVGVTELAYPHVVVPIWISE